MSAAELRLIVRDIVMEAWQNQRHYGITWYACPAGAACPASVFTSQRIFENSQLLCVVVERDRVLHLLSSYLADLVLRQSACRRSPALLERSHWSDAQGNPLGFHTGQAPRHCPESWEVAVTVSTDADGWQYASVFK